MALALALTAGVGLEADAVDWVALVALVVASTLVEGLGVGRLGAGGLAAAEGLALAVTAFAGGFLAALGRLGATGIGVFLGAGLAALGVGLVGALALGLLDTAALALTALGLGANAGLGFVALAEPDFLAGTAFVGAFAGAFASTFVGALVGAFASAFFGALVGALPALFWAATFLFEVFTSYLLAV